MPITKRGLLVAAVIAAAGVLVAAGIASSLIGAAGRSTPTSSAPGRVRLAVGSLVDRTVPDFALRDERGRPVSLGDYRGRYLLLSPSMTLCHEVCPMTTAVLEQIRSTLRREGLGGQVAVAEATVDPWRDTPARLRAYRRMTGVGFDMLTGTPAQIARLWRFFGVYYRRVPQDDPPDRDWLTHQPERFDVEHTDALLIIDPRGHWRAASLGMPSTAGPLPVALRKLLNDQGRDNLRHPDQPWTAKQAIADVIALRRRDETAAGAHPAPVRPTPSADGARAMLHGSPRPLAALHAQSGQLLRAGPGDFHARLAALRGRPVVVNAGRRGAGRAGSSSPCCSAHPLASAGGLRSSASTSATTPSRPAASSRTTP